MYNYFNHLLLKWHCGFCEGFSTKHCLLVMTQKWRKCLEKSGISEVILADLSKALNCLLYEFLIAKLFAYVFDYRSLKSWRLFFLIDSKEQKLKMSLVITL